MDIEFKIKEDMRRLGCKSETKISLACYLYLYLVDEKLMYDTEYCYNKDIDTLYVVARPCKNAKTNLYVPLPVTTDVSMEFIGRLQENLCTVETGHQINLAFIESDTTTVIYSFTKGLVERQKHDTTLEVNRIEERRRFINNELRNKHSEILNDALNGGVVDDDECQILE